MKIKDYPTIFVLMLKNGQVNFFIIMENLIVHSFVDRFVHFKVFNILMEGYLLFRGSLMTERGGRTIPPSIFCQEDFSYSFYFFALSN